MRIIWLRLQVRCENDAAGRIGEAEEVTRAIVWLGFKRTFSTGSEVVVDGGLMFVREG